MTEFDNDDNDTVIPDDFREMHVSCSRNKTKNARFIWDTC